VAGGSQANNLHICKPLACGTALTDYENAPEGFWAVKGPMFWIKCNSED